MDDPVLAVVEGREIRRSEMIARTWASQDEIVEICYQLSDKVHAKLADTPTDDPFEGSEFHYHVDCLRHAYGAQDEHAACKALARIVAHLNRLKERGVL